MKVKKALLVIGMLLGCVALTRGTSGLGYQSETDVDFVVNDNLGMTLSGQGSFADFVISNLMPGNYAISNTVTINVTSNDPGGYTLSATVGNGTTYTDSSLVNTTVSGHGLVSLEVGYPGVPISGSGFPAGRWGYVRTVDNSNPTLNNFEGLSYGSWNTLNATKDVSGTTMDVNMYPGGNVMKITIGAKATSNQAAGEYRNVIRFMLVGNVLDPDFPEQTLEESYAAAGKTKYAGYYKLQDMTSAICAATVAVDEESQMRAIDVRDGKVYWIAKLRDGHCWMTQNLDLDLDNSVTYTHADTDLGWGSDATAMWIPTNSTVQLNSDGSSFQSFSADNNVPMSLNTGDWYYAGYDGSTLLADTSVNYLTSANRTTTNGVTMVNNGSGVVYYANAPFDINGTHGHVGNYYSWSAAVASNDTSGYTTSTAGNVDNDPQNSICPAGWRLPTASSSRPSYGVDGSRHEYERLVYLYDGTTINPSSSAVLEGSPLFFPRAGYVYLSASYSGQQGYYWSSTVYSATQAWNMFFQRSGATPQNYGSRSALRSVRCLAR